MKVIELKCPSCDADIELDDSREIGFCCYCGMKILIKVPTAKIDGIAGIDNLLLRANQFVQEGNINKAKEYYNRVLDIDINNEVAQKGLDLIGERTNPFIKGIESEVEVIALNKFNATIRFKAGQKANIHVSQLAVKNTCAIRNILNIGDRLTVVCQGSNDGGIPIFVEKGALELKKVQADNFTEKKEDRLFIDRLRNAEKAREQAEIQRKADIDNEQAEHILNTIKTKCMEEAKEHKIEGYYCVYNDDGYTERRIETFGSNLLYCNLQVLVDIVSDKIRELGFINYEVRIDKVPYEYRERIGYSIWGTEKYEIKKSVSEWMYIRIEW